MNGAKAPQTAIRLPDDVRQWLKDQAIYNCTSLSAEAIRAIRERMALEERRQQSTAKAG
jgi:predicted transcriptional regulator